MKMNRVLVVSFFASLVYLTSCVATPDAAEFSIRLPELSDDSPLAEHHSLAGGNLSPQIAWAGVPAGTKSLVFVCRDLDAGGFVHWGMYNISPELAGLDAGLPVEVELPNGIVQTKNSFGRVGWGGPAPPSGTHRYEFSLYALDTLLQPATNKDNWYVVELLMEDRILASASVVHSYTRQ